MEDSFRHVMNVEWVIVIQCEAMGILLYHYIWYR